MDVVEPARLYEPGLEQRRPGHPEIPQMHAVVQITEHESRPEHQRGKKRHPGKRAKRGTTEVLPKEKRGLGRTERAIQARCFQERRDGPWHFCIRPHGAIGRGRR
jgi:hypothetical protein